MSGCNSASSHHGLLLALVVVVSTAVSSAAVDADITPVDDAPLLGIVEPVLDSHVDEWLPVVVARESSDGIAVPSLYIIRGAMFGVTQKDLETNGFLVLTHAEAASFASAPALWSMRTGSEVDAFIVALQESRAADDDAIDSHPTAPINYQTSLPVSANYDNAERLKADYYNTIVRSFDAADGLLSSEVGINIHRYYLSFYSDGDGDVSNYCEMQQVAREEALFRPHVGVFVAIFSPGTVNGAWGVMRDGPITAQIQYSSNYDDCTGGSHSPRDIPSSYVMHKPANSETYMQHLTAHEFAHQFNDKHQYAQCWWQNAVYHKTNEAFSGGSGLPPGCNFEPSYYRWDYSQAGVDGMTGERNKWTICYNGLNCS